MKETVFNAAEASLNFAANQIDNGIDFVKKGGARLVVRGVMAASVALTPAAAAVSPEFGKSVPTAQAAGETFPIPKNECRDVPAGSMVVGDVWINGEPSFPIPQSGNYQNRVWMDQGANVCGREDAGKYHTNADEAYNAEQERSMTCQGGSKCDGSHVHRYPSQMPKGPEPCFMDTQPMKPGDVINDTLICASDDPNREVHVPGFSSDQQDGVVVGPNGEVLYNPDGNKNTGQFTINSGSEGIVVRSKFKGDVENDSGLTPAEREARNNDHICEMLGTNSEGVVVVRVVNGRAMVTRVTNGAEVCGDKQPGTPATRPCTCPQSMTVDVPKAIVAGLYIGGKAQGNMVRGGGKILV